jgi:CLIP-associating protein 1/2
LIVIWEALENQSVYLDGKESELFSTILRVRYSNKITVSTSKCIHTLPNEQQVLEGTNAIRDALTSKLDPVYGLTTVHANLKAFHAEPPPSPEDEEVKSATYAFGLMALGKFILRLPAEIAEEELPRLKVTLTTVCLLLHSTVLFDVMLTHLVVER